MDNNQSVKINVKLGCISFLVGLISILLYV